MTQYVHKYYPEITCETVSTTARGWKVLQKDPKHKKKPKVAFMTLSISVTKKVSGLQKKIPDFFNGVPDANTSPKGIGKSND